MELRDFPAFYPEPEMIEGAPAQQRSTDGIRPHPTVMASKVQAELHPIYVGSDALLSKNLRTKKKLTDQRLRPRAVGGEPILPE